VSGANYREAALIVAGVPRRAINLLSGVVIVPFAG
jgi:hypothetical protein